MHQRLSNFNRFENLPSKLRLQKYGASTVRPKIALRESGFSSFDNLDGSVLNRGPRVFGQDASKKQEYIKLGDALYEAVKANNVDLIQQLCTVGIDGTKADPDYSDEFGFSCMHLAAKVKT